MFLRRRNKSNSRITYRREKREKWMSTWLGSHRTLLSLNLRLVPWARSLLYGWELLLLNLLNYFWFHCSIQSPCQDRNGIWYVLVFTKQQRRSFLHSSKKPCDQRLHSAFYFLKLTLFLVVTVSITWKSEATPPLLLSFSMDNQILTYMHVCTQEHPYLAVFF